MLDQPDSAGELTYAWQVAAVAAEEFGGELLRPWPAANLLRGVSLDSKQRLECRLRAPAAV